MTQSATAAQQAEEIDIKLNDALGDLETALSNGLADLTVIVTAHIALGLTTTGTPAMFVDPGGTLALAVDADLNVTGEGFVVGILEVSADANLTYHIIARSC